MAIFNSYVKLPEGIILTSALYHHFGDVVSPFWFSFPEATERWNPTLAKSHLFPKAWGRCLASNAQRSASARDRCAAKMLAQEVGSQRAQVTATETWKDGEFRWFKQQKPVKTHATSSKNPWNVGISQANMMTHCEKEVI